MIRIELYILSRWKVYYKVLLVPRQVPDFVLSCCETASSRPVALVIISGPCLAN